MGRRSREVELRCEVVRSRVEDWLRRTDLRQTYDSRLEQQQLFVRRAIRLGREKGVRVFADKSRPAEESGLQSLQYLLREKRTWTNGKEHTGYNESWVLDLWELVLTESTRPALREEEPDEVLEPDEVFEDGVIVFATSSKTTPAAPSLPAGFSNRLLEAWIGRDEGAFIELARQIEGLERGEAAA